MSGETSRRGSRWLLPAGVFGVVALVQLWLVAGAGTDVPFFDQWDAEGRALYPAWIDGSWSVGSLFAPHNEHRILWTRLLDLGLFVANGQWDPLVQLAVNALLHGAAAAMLAAVLTHGQPLPRAVVLAAGTAGLCLPLLGWHNALWGFQSQVYFCLLFALAAIALLAPAPVSRRRLAAGSAVTVAAMLAMGAGLLVAPAVGAAWLVRRERDRRAWVVLAALGLVAWGLQTPVATHVPLRAHSAAEFLGSLVRLLAWPDRQEPWMALVLNLPLLVFVLARFSGRLPRVAGEELLASVAAWVLLAAGATAWSRGGGGEFQLGVPSRYADFFTLLPLVNLWCLVALRPAVPGLWGAVGWAWAALLVLTWSGAVAVEWRGVIRPRLGDRDAPARLARQFQATRDPAVFAGQPRLYLAHPEPAVIAAVLDDPRLRHRLPPSFSADDRAPGPLSRAVRAVLGR